MIRLFLRFYKNFSLFFTLVVSADTNGFMPVLVNNLLSG